MKENEYDKLLDSVIHESIEKSLEELQEQNMSYSEKIFDQILEKHNIPNDLNEKEDFIEIFYKEFEDDVKRTIMQENGDWIKKEIEKLKRRLGQ